MILAQEKEVMQLCRHLDAYLSASSAGHHSPLDAAMINFAISRHKVGPLLYRALSKNPDSDGGKNWAPKLQSAYRNNCMQYLQKKSIEQDLEKRLAALAIPFKLIKGSGLARQIYADPTDRFSRDVDIMVDPGDFKRALSSLREAGYIVADNRSKKTIRPGVFGTVAYARLFKDVTLVHPGLGVLVELHLRLFHLEPADYSADVYAASGDQIVPEISDNHYLLYLILHGAMVHWPRLRMIVDLALLVRKTPVEQAYQCLELAKSYDAAPAFLASLEFLEQLFPDSLSDDWKMLLDENEGLRHRQMIFVEQFRLALMNSAEDNPSHPPKHSNFWMLSHDLFPKHVTRIRVKLQHIAGSIAVRL